MARQAKKPIKIEILCREKGLKLKELAIRADIKPRSLSEWTQRRTPTTDVYKLQRLADVLECEIEDILEPLDSYDPAQLKNTTQYKKK